MPESACKGTARSTERQRRCRTATTSAAAHHARAAPARQHAETSSADIITAARQCRTVLQEHSRPAAVLLQAARAAVAVARSAAITVAVRTAAVRSVATTAEVRAAAARSEAACAEAAATVRTAVAVTSEDADNNKKTTIFKDRIHK